MLLGRWFQDPDSPKGVVYAAAGQRREKQTESLGLHGTEEDLQRLGIGMQESPWQEPPLPPHAVLVQPWCIPRQQVPAGDTRGSLASPAARLQNAAPSRAHVPRRKEAGTHRTARLCHTIT